jgi:CIC family chloride channel protein
MTFFLFVLLIIDNGMKAENPSSSAHQFVRVRRSDAVRRLIQRDKTPLAVLLMGRCRHAGGAGRRRV